MHARMARQWKARALPGAAMAMAIALSLAFPAHSTESKAGPGSPSPAFKTVGQKAQPSWMQSIPDTMPLAQMSIPGTHETMAFTGTAFAEAQELNGDPRSSLTTPLDAGIRALDIRVHPKGGVFGDLLHIWHGVTDQNANLGHDVLAPLDAWLKDHPSETVLMNLSAEDFTDKDASSYCPGEDSATCLSDFFKDYVGKGKQYSDTFWSPSIAGDGRAATPTLGQVRGKVVLNVFRNSAGNPYPGWGLNYGSSDDYKTHVQDQYKVGTPAAITAKWGQVRDFLALTRKNGAESLPYYNFLSGTGIPFMTPSDVAGGGSTGSWDPTDPPTYFTGVNERALNFLSTDSGERTGVLMMDFPGYGLISEIIRHNPTSRPGTLVEQNGQMNVFARAADGNLVRSVLSYDAQGNQGSWVQESVGADLKAPRMGGNPVATVRNDKTLDVFYRSGEGHLIEAWKSPGSGWEYADFAERAYASAVMAGDPAVVNQDGTVRVFSRDASNSHLMESVLPTQGTGAGKWQKWDHTDVTRAPLVDGGVTAVVRQDKTVDVVYRTAGGQVNHSHLSGTSWTEEIVPAEPLRGAGRLGPAAGDLSVVAQGDTITFFSRDAETDHLTESLLTGGVWVHTDLTPVNHAPQSSGSPSAAFRTDGTLDVYYRSPDGHLIQAWLTPRSSDWQYFDLSDPRYGYAPARIVGDPAVAIRPGKVSVFTQSGTGSHLTESWLATTVWSNWDLTADGKAPVLG
ncbi:hypothetical protein ABTZ03_29820 [Kitasatospora sp. NPDC096077]|uniref:hypothetical protein n=1 Tax=Kitasatospora sp. NPDC096077 TaxID=3155544 RepID=UPI0033198AC3